MYIFTSKNVDLLENLLNVGMNAIEIGMSYDDVRRIVNETKNRCKNWLKITFAILLTKRGYS